MTSNEDRLRRALRAGSGYRPTSDGDWAAFESRLAQSSRGSTRRQAPRWRMPLIAAAAVAAIAVSTAAIVTGGFGAGSGQPMSQPAVDSTCAVAESTTTPVTVPVDSGGAAEAGSGVGGAVTDTTATATAGASTGTPASPVGTSTSRAKPSAGGGPASAVTMFFAGGTPPRAHLCTTFVPVGQGVAGNQQTSDGTPLGYLSLAGGGSDGARYLWGAVGPDVLQVQINAVQPPTQGDIDPGFHIGPHWTIDSGKGTPWSLPEAADISWTAIGGGWHAFALLLPSATLSTDAIALDNSGRPVQVRSIDLSTGAVSDGLLPQQTGTPPAGAATGTLISGSMSPGPPVAGSKSPGSSASTATPTQSEVSATADAAAQCGVAGSMGLSVSDVGFGLGTVTFWSAGRSTCFYDGRTWWQAGVAVDGALPAVHLTGAGPFPSQLAGGSTTQGRFVWGLYSTEVQVVTATVGATTFEPIVGPASPAWQGPYFLIRVPATGVVTVTATGSDGSVLQTVRLDAPTR